MFKSINQKIQILRKVPLSKYPIEKLLKSDISQLLFFLSDTFDYQ